MKSQTPLEVAKKLLDEIRQEAEQGRFNAYVDISDFKNPDKFTDLSKLRELIVEDLEYYQNKFRIIIKLAQRYYDTFKTFTCKCGYPTNCSLSLTECEQANCSWKDEPEHTESEEDVISL